MRLSFIIFAVFVASINATPLEQRDTPIIDPYKIASEKRDTPVIDPYKIASDKRDTPIIDPYKIASSSKRDE